MTEPDFDAIRAEAEALAAERAKGPPRAINCAYVSDDGTIMGVATCGSEDLPPDGLMMIEGDYDQDTQRFDTAAVARIRSAGLLPPDAFPVVNQTEMNLTSTPSVPANGETIASVTGIPPHTRFYMSEENKATPVDDGELTVTFDTPGTYSFTFTHKGYLDTVVTIEATEPP